MLLKKPSHFYVKRLNTTTPCIIILIANYIKDDFKKPFMLETEVAFSSLYQAKKYILHDKLDKCFKLKPAEYFSLRECLVYISKYSLKGMYI